MINRVGTISTALSSKASPLLSSEEEVELVTRWQKHGGNIEKPGIASL